MNSKSRKYVSPLLLVLAAMIWGFAFSAQKSAEAVSPFLLGSARSFIATLFLIPIIIIFDRTSKSGRRLFSAKCKIDLTPTELIGGTICGIILALASFLQQSGINAGTNSGKAAFITALYVVIVPIYALLLKKRAPINVWISVVIAAFGFYLLCITGDFTIVPSDILVIMCAFIFPIHILAIDKYSPKCDGVRMSCVQFFVCGVLNLILALIFESPINTTALVSAILPIIYLGVGSSGIAYTLQIIGQKGVNPAAASILLSLESVFGVIGSVIFIGEKMSLREYLGCAVVLFAVILSQLDLKSILNKKKDS